MLVAPHHLRWTGVVSRRQVGTLEIPHIFHWGSENAQAAYSAWQFHVYTRAALECMIQFSGGERFHIFGVFGQSSLSELKKLHYLQTLFPNLQKGIKFFLIFNTIFKNHFSLERSLCVFMFGCVRARLLCLGSCVIFSCSMGSLNYNTWDLVPQPRIGPGPPALGAGES